MPRDICPNCGPAFVLEWLKDHKKLGCKRCGFIDRRHGNTVIDAAKDRRGTGGIENAWDTLSKWVHLQ